MSSSTADSTSEPLGWPLSYLITYRCYGTWLHGDDRGSVDRNNRMYGQPYCPPDRELEREVRVTLRHGLVTLSPMQRQIVELAVKEVCIHRDWELVAVNARTNHVHVVVSAQQSPERVMNTFKAWSTRALRQAKLASGDAKLWAQHGSTRYLWTDDAVAEAQRYVAAGQDGERFNTEQNPGAPRAR